MEDEPVSPSFDGLRGAPGFMGQRAYETYHDRMDRPPAS